VDAVYLFGGAGGEDELKFSLRTVGNLRQVDRVVVAGHPPDWLAGEVLHVPPAGHPPGKHHSTWANLRAACADRRLSDEFVLMNDDFFVLEPVDAVPVWHAGVLTNRPVLRKHHDRRRDATLAVLATLGSPGRLSYELHVPMVIHRRLMLALMDEADALRPAGADPVWKRTLYGNLAHPGVGELHTDVKARDVFDVPADGQLFVSASDFTWRRGAVGRWVRTRFPDRCRYERG